METWCTRDNCPGRNPLPPHVPENVAEFHKRISAQHERYRADYRCPICDGDKNRFMRCEYPGCPDGCDQPGRFKTYPSEPGSVKCISCIFMTTLLVIALLGALLFSCARPAAAFDHGFDKSTPRSKWFAGLQVPKPDPADTSEATKEWFGELKRQDKMPDSCCGQADAYEADIFQHNPKTAREPWGSYDVTITNGEDEHPWPDGTHRTPIKNGTVVHVPGNKVNPPKETKNNPTGHSWLFVSTKRDITNEVSPGTIYCFAPLPEGS
jgi:hypothetical protein